MSINASFVAYILVTSPKTLEVYSYKQLEWLTPEGHLYITDEESDVRLLKIEKNQQIGHQPTADKIFSPRNWNIKIEVTSPVLPQHVLDAFHPFSITGD